jgi:hypothetical protein
MIPSRILHGCPIPTECVGVKVTTIREDHKFNDLDYPNEEEGIEKLVDAKGTFILWSRKDIIVKTRSSSIVSPRSTEAKGTPTSNMLKPTQNSQTSMTPPPAQDPELQDNTELRLPSPPAQVPKLQDFTGKRPPSPPAQNQELQDTTGKSSPSPTQNQETP